MSTKKLIFYVLLGVVAFSLIARKASGVTGNPLSTAVSS